MTKHKQITFTIPDHISEDIEKFSTSQQKEFEKAIDKSMKDFVVNQSKSKENYSSSKTISLDEFLKQQETSDKEFESLKKELRSLPDIEFKVQDEQEEEKKKLKSILSRYSNASDEELDRIVNKSFASLPSPAPSKENFSSSSSSSASSSGAGYWDYVIQENNRQYRNRKEQDIHRGL